MQEYIKQAQNGLRIEAKGFAVLDKKSAFTHFHFSRHPLGENDVLIEILYAGICHSDIHCARSEWREGIYPMVPGHEIVGKIIALGTKVSKFKLGDYAGVGCMINSCKECEACNMNQEQFCQKGKTVFTYDNLDCFHQFEPTYGGYSDNIVVNEEFVIKIPSNAPMQKIAPLFCAGITTYSPLKFAQITKNDKVGIAGFGGLGIMALKYALKMNAEVFVFARNEKKKDIALKLGAKALYTTDKLSEVKERFKLIICTIPTNYEVIDYVKLLKQGGELCIVGLPPVDAKVSLNINDLVFNAHKKVYGSLIGGIKQTQEMLDFSIKHQIYPEIELISADELDLAYEKLTSGKADFRYVIDMKKSLSKFKNN